MVLIWARIETVVIKRNVKYTYLAVKLTGFTHGLNEGEGKEKRIEPSMTSSYVA